MANAILTTKTFPAYDDMPDRRYHFPKQYLRRMEQVVGDYVIYYEPSRVGSSDSNRTGSKSYFALARVTGIDSSPRRDGTYYARIDRYLDFDQLVPFRAGDFFYESALRKPDGTTNRGVAGHSVRFVPPNEFHNILHAGYIQPVIYKHDKSQTSFEGLADIEVEDSKENRPILERVERRRFRDRVFSHRVHEADREQCSLTGLRLINGGGRAEVEAAHIRPIGDGHNGPDSIWNGIALSRTAHWMFDRGLVSLEDDYGIIVSPQAPENAHRLLRPEMMAGVPDSLRERPHPSFLKYHRDNIFRQ